MTAKQLLAPWFVLLALAAPAQALAWASPREAVEQFLAFELDGGRLQSWPAKRFFAVDSGFDEPGWERVHVVESHEVQQTDCSADRCTVRVNFNYVPTRQIKMPRFHSHPAGGSEVVELVAVRVSGQWRLQPLRDSPRVQVLHAKKLLKRGF